MGERSTWQRGRLWLCGWADEGERGPAAPNIRFPGRSSPLEWHAA
jgi:hypothetical protein